MKKIWVKALSIVIIGSLLGGTFVACGKNAEKSNENKTGENTSKVSWESAPKVKVAMRNNQEIAYGKTGDDPQDNQYSRYVFEKSGIRIEYEFLPEKIEEFNQKFSILLAGGNIIDMVTFSNLQQVWMDSGTIITVNSLLEKYKSQIPNIMKNIPEDGWEAAKKLDDIWAIPQRGSLPKPDLRYLFVRKDWLDKLKMDMPKSTDDIAKTLKAFRENDPDGNGKKDTYGFGTTKNFSNEDLMMYLFGVDTWREDIIDNSRLLSQAYSDRARYGFKTIGDWHKNDYIDKEGLTDTKALETKIVNNKIGMYWGQANMILDYTNTLGDNGFKDAQWALVKNQVVSSFDNKFYGWVKMSNASTYNMITAVTKNYENIFKLLNWMYSEEGTDFQIWGIAGREFNVVDGKRVKDVQYNIDKRTYLGSYQLGKSYFTYDKQNILDKYKNTDLVKTVVEEQEKNYDKYVWKSTDIKFMYPKMEAFKTYPDWRKGITTYGAKFYLGELNPMDDKVWKQFIEESNKYGCQALLDEAAKNHFKKK